LGSKSKHQVICYVCGGWGYLTKDGKYYKVTHNRRVKKGEWTTKKCHLGSGKKTLTKLRLIAENNPDVIEPGILKEIEDNLPKSFEQEYSEKLESSGVATLITKVLELSKSLGEGWISLYKARFHDWNWSKCHWSKCPYCDQRVGVVFLYADHRVLSFSLKRSNKPTNTDILSLTGSSPKQRKLKHPYLLDKKQHNSII